MLMPRAHALDGAHEPEGLVDAVDALVGRRAAAVVLPGAAPAGRVAAGKITICAEPLQPEVAKDGSADPACVQGLLDEAGAQLVAALEVHCQQLTALFRRGKHLVDLGRGNVHGLGGEGVLAGLQALDGQVAVGAAGREDADGVDVLPLQQRAVVGVPVAAVFRRLRLCQRLLQVTDRHQLRPVRGRRLLHPRLADTKTDNAKPNRIILRCHGTRPPEFGSCVRL